MHPPVMDLWIRVEIIFMEADCAVNSVQCQLSYEVPTHSIQDRLNQEQAIAIAMIVYGMGQIWIRF